MNRPASGLPTLPSINTNNIIVITDAPYNAVGDGVTDNTLAISNAIVTAAAGGTVEIPPGIFLSGPLTFKSGVNLQIDGGAVLRMLPFGRHPFTWVTNGARYWFTNTLNFISGSGLTDIEISGSGAIDGQSAPWWPWAYTVFTNHKTLSHMRQSFVLS